MVHYLVPEQCKDCRHLRGEPRVGNERWSCRAFPEGIPDDIYLGEFDHTEPHWDDGGIQYEEIKK